MGKNAPAEPTRPFALVILAAGKGTRMQTRLPKALQPICSRPLVEYVIEAVRPLAPREIRVVVGYGADQIKRVLGDTVVYTRQRSQKGTGHALRQCRSAYRRFRGDILVVTADQPRMRTETFRRLLDEHRRTGAAATLLTNRPADPTGYGRILRTKNGKLRGIVEERDCTAAQRKLREVNTTTYIFRTEDVFPVLEEIGEDNAQGEQYLPDVIGLFAKARTRLASVKAQTPDETDQVSNQEDLARMTAVIRDEINAVHMANVVQILDPPSTFIGPDVQIGADTMIYPNTQIEGSARIGQGARLGPNTYIDEADIGDSAAVVMSYVTHCLIQADARVGPYAHIRPESKVGRGARVGNFVEVKKTVLGDGVKASHLTYLGDARIGAGTNIGAGTITANFDGEFKHETEIGAGVKVGSGTIFVAPVVVGDNVVTGAGAVVTRNQVVPAGTTLVGVPAVPLPDRAKRKSEKRRAK